MKISEAEVIFEVSRSSGPGGQHVQKTSSRVTIRWHVASSQVLTDEEKSLVLGKLSNRINKLGEFVLHVETHRSQLRNKKLALILLNDLVVQALRKIKKRKKTRPTLASVERRLDEKMRAKQRKLDRKKNDANT